MFYHKLTNSTRRGYVLWMIVWKASFKDGVKWNHCSLLFLSLSPPVRPSLISELIKLLSEGPNRLPLHLTLHCLIQKSHASLLPQHFQAFACLEEINKLDHSSRPSKLCGRSTGHFAPRAQCYAFVLNQPVVNIQSHPVRGSPSNTWQYVRAIGAPRTISNDRFSHAFSFSLMMVHTTYKQRAQNTATFPSCIGRVFPWWASRCQVELKVWETQPNLVAIQQWTAAAARWCRLLLALVQLFENHTCRGSWVRWGWRVFWGYVFFECYVGNTLWRLWCGRRRLCCWSYGDECWAAPGLDTLMHLNLVFAEDYNLEAFDDGH